MDLFSLLNTGLGSFEKILNRWVFKLFPIWYLRQIAPTVTLDPLGPLNPPSFLRARWLNLPETFDALTTSLPQEAQWQELRLILNKLISKREATRMIPINFINGVDFSIHAEEWPSLLSYAEHHPLKNFEITEADEFGQKLAEAFPYEKRPHRMVYREWDGRMYWLNDVEPSLVAMLQQYCAQFHRDGQVFAQIITESFNAAALERLRNQWWLLLFNKNSIQPLFDLMQEAKLPITLGAFAPNRDDLAFLVARKNNRHLNRVLLSLIHQRSAQNVLEFGSYISRHHHPLVKQAQKGGEIAPQTQ